MYYVPYKAGVFSLKKFFFLFIGSKKISKSEENLLTPKKSNDSSYRMSWTGPPPLNEVCDDGTPLSGYLYAGNCYSEPVLVTGKPPAIPKNIHSITGSYTKENHQREDSLCADEECQAQNTVRRITQAFIETGSDLNAFVGCSKSSAQEPPAFISEPQIDSKALFSGSVIEIDHLTWNTSTSEPQTEFDFTIGSNKDCNGDANEDLLEGIYKEENVEKEVNALETPAVSLEIITHQGSPQIVLKIVEENNADSMSTTHTSPHKLECDVNVFESRSGNDSTKSDYQVPGEIVGLSENNVPIPGSSKASCSPVSQGIHSVPAPVRRSSRVSDHIQHFNRLCLNDLSLQKVKSPIKFQRTPVRQSVRRINSLHGVKRCVDNTQAADGTTSSPMVKSVSCDGSLSLDLSSTRSNHRLFSAGSQENATSFENLPTFSLRGASSKFSKQKFVNASSSLNSVKSVLEDLTNQDISRSTCLKPDLSTNGPKNALRMMSNREHNRYRGSPKNPIGKVTFLPASKPLDL